MSGFVCARGFSANRAWSPMTIQKSSLQTGRSFFGRLPRLSLAFVSKVALALAVLTDLHTPFFPFGNGCLSAPNPVTKRTSSANGDSRNMFYLTYCN